MIQVMIPDTISEPSRQGKRWSSDEDEMLLRLYKAGDMWDDMSAKLGGCSGHARKFRFFTNCVVSRKTIK